MSHQNILLVSTMRSGSTYLRNLLSANASVYSYGPERNEIWSKYNCKVGIVPQCAPVSGEDKAGINYAELKEYFERRYRSRNGLRQIVHRLYRGIRFGNETLFKGRDAIGLYKTTQFLTRLDVLEMVFDDTRHVMLVRDVYSQVYSQYNHFKRIYDKKGLQAEYDTHNCCWNFRKPSGVGFEMNCADLTHYWISHNYAALKWLEENKTGSHLIVNYSDLVNDCDGEISRIGRLLGLAMNRKLNTRAVNNTTADPLCEWKNKLGQSRLLEIDDTLSNNDALYQYIQNKLASRDT